MMEALTLRGEEEVLGFPPPLLGSEPVRLTVRVSHGEWCVVPKAAGLRVRADSGIGDALHDLDSAIWAQAKRGLPSWEALGFSPSYRPKSAFSMEPEVAGVGVFGLNEEWSERLRNEYGSNLMWFRFLFLVRATGVEGDEFQVDLPIAPHSREAGRWLVSHRTGKKALTRFKKLRDWASSGVALWEAEATYLRGPQVRLHAAEVGLKIIGDGIYGDAGGLRPEELMVRRAVRPSASAEPVWPDLHLALAELRSTHLGAIPVPLPLGMQMVLRKLDAREGESTKHGAI